MKEQVIYGHLILLAHTTPLNKYSSFKYYPW